jgi:pimeloyl-ACP methyl ester carboxylesterase
MNTKVGRHSLLARALSCASVVPMCLQAAAAAAQAAPAPAAGAAPAPGGGRFAADPRAQVRTYHFADAGQDMQYCVFASSKVSRPRPAPLIVSLHGMGAPPTIMCNTTAPASFMMNDDRGRILGRIKEAGVPVLLLTGDADEVVPPANTRMWAQTLQELNVDHEYIEQPGVTHGPVITTSQKAIYDFFARHPRK